MPVLDGALAPRRSCRGRAHVRTCDWRIATWRTRAYRQSGVRRKNAFDIEFADDTLLIVSCGKYVGRYAQAVAAAGGALGLRINWSKVELLAVGLVGPVV